MFKISSNNIMSIIKNDTLAFDINFNNYTIQKNDTVMFSIKKDINDIDTVLEINADIADNKASVKIEKFNLDVGEYVYDIKVVLEDGYTDTVILPTQFNVLRGVSNE